MHVSLRYMVTSVQSAASKGMAPSVASNKREIGYGMGQKHCLTLNLGGF